MKKCTLGFLALAVSGLAHAQSPVLTIGNTPPSNAILVKWGQASASGVSSPAQGANMSWNYGALATTFISDVSYVPGSNSLVPQTNLVFAGDFAELVPGYGYYYNGLYRLGSGFSMLARELEAQSYSMLPVTGIATDSLTITAQTSAYSAQATILPASATYTDYWQSVYSFNLDALVDISAFGMMDLPTQKRSHVVQQDSVVGWGTMVVPVQNGVSIPYPVLMVKRMQTTTDSMYMNGSPAPAPILSALNQTQGQVTRDNRYVFYRQGSIVPLVEFRYGSSPFTQLNEIFLDRDPDLQINGVAAGVTQLPVQLYPNPTSGSQLTIQFEKAASANWKFALTDLAGRLVYQQQITGTGAAVDQKIMLPQNAANGLYLWQLTDTNGNLKSAGKVNLAR